MVLLENFIRKYGKNKGTEKYYQWYNNLIDSHSKGYSKESIKFWNEMFDYLKNKGIKIGNVYYGKEEKGFYSEKMNKTLFVDLYMEEYNIAFEYNGIAFHPNPCWNKNKFENWVMPFSGITSWNAIKYDLIKFNFLDDKFDQLFVYYSDESKLYFFEYVYNYIGELNDTNKN